MKRITLKGSTFMQTLLALLVIAVLAFIVYKILGSATVVGNDTDIQATIKGVRLHTEQFGEANNTYDNVCYDPDVSTDIVKALQLSVPTATASDIGYFALDAGSTPTAHAHCNSNTNEWAIAVPLQAQDNGAAQYFCIDSQNVNRTLHSIPAGVTQCPQSL